MVDRLREKFSPFIAFIGIDLSSDCSDRCVTASWPVLAPPGSVFCRVAITWKLVGGQGYEDYKAL